MAARTTQAKHFNVVINNPTMDDMDKLILAENDANDAHSHIEWIAWQFEVGESGTFHVQATVSFIKKVRYGSKMVRGFFPRGAFKGVRDQTPAGRKNYVHKEDTRATAQQCQDYWGPIIGYVDWTETMQMRVGPQEAGQMPAAERSRTDITAAISLLDEEGVERMAEEMPLVYLRYNKAWKDLAFMRKKKKAMQPREIEVIVCEGPTASGKSHWAFQEAGQDVFVVNAEGRNTIWWDGYNFESTVIFEEFRPSWCTYAELLRFLDKWPLPLRVKGSKTWALWTKVIITTTHPWRNWYDVADSATGELARRITRVLKFTPANKGVPEVEPGATEDPNIGVSDAGSSVPVPGQDAVRAPAGHGRPPDWTAGYAAYGSDNPFGAGGGAFGATASAAPRQPQVRSRSTSVFDAWRLPTPEFYDE